MLVRVFDNLMVDVDENHRERIEKCVAAAANLQLIQVDMDNCVYIYNSTNAEATIHEFNEILDCCESNDNKVIYFDQGKSICYKIWCLKSCLLTPVIYLQCGIHRMAD